MMTIEEVLKTQGLTPEQIAGVMKGMQDNHIQLLTPEQEKQIKLNDPPKMVRDRFKFCVNSKI